MTHNFSFYVEISKKATKSQLRKYSIRGVVSFYGAGYVHPHMKVIAFQANGITVVDVVFTDSIIRLELSARWDIVYFDHVKEDV